MPHPRNPGFRAGENWQCCPVCGFEYRASDFKRRWDGLIVCKYDWEPRHLQDLLRVTPDDMRPAVSTGACCDDGTTIDLRPCGVIGFVNTAYTTDASTVTIHVKRTGGTKDEAVVSYTTVDGTALAGTNYTATSGTLTWAAGEDGVKSIVVPIVSGRLSDTAFTVTLIVDSGCVTLGEDVTTVTIPAIVVSDPVHVLVGDEAQFSSGNIVWSLEAYDRGDWWTSGSSVFVPAGVNYVRLTGQSNSGQPLNSQHIKNGVTFIGAGSEDSTTQGSDFVNFASGPIPVVEGDFFQQTSSADPTLGSWMHIEKVEDVTRMALAYNSATQTVVAATPTALSFNSELYDTASMFSGSGTKIIIPAGVSLVQVFAGCETDNVTGAFRMYLRVNGSQIYGCPKKSEDTADSDRLTLSSATLEVSEGDEIECIVQTTQNAVIQSNAWFSVVEVPLYHARALVYKSATQSFSASTNTVAQWGSTVYDNAELVSGTTKFVIPAGYTQARIAANIEIDIGGGIQLYMFLRKNGSSFLYRFEDHSDVTGLNTVSGITAWLDVVQGDEFDVVFSADATSWFDNKSSWFFIEAR